MNQPHVPIPITYDPDPIYRDCEMVPLSELLVSGDASGESLSTQYGPALPLVLPHGLLLKSSRLFRNLKQIAANAHRVVISIGGPSGSGKTTVASLLGSYLIAAGHPCYVLSLDNYPHLPARQNEQRRFELFQQGGEAALSDYLATQKEIDFQRLFEIVREFKLGSSEIVLRRMNLRQDLLERPSFMGDFRDTKVLLLEGTWSGLVRGVDWRVHLEVSSSTSRARREHRGRDKLSDFGETTLRLEKELLEAIRSVTDILVHEDCSLTWQHMNNSTGETEAMLSSLRERTSEKFPHQVCPLPNSSLFPRSPAPARFDTTPAHPLDQVMKRCLTELQRSVGPYGFLASTENVGNYHRVWARDSVMVGLAGLAAQDSGLNRGFRASLENLAKYQRQDGLIASNLQRSERGIESISFGKLSGRVDPMLWFVIGVCNYAALGGEPDFAQQYRPHIEKVLRLAESLEINGRGFIFIPSGGDWADEYIYFGYVLLPQLLRLWALRCVSETFKDQTLSQEATELQQRIAVNYWPCAECLAHPEKNARVYLPTAYSSYLTTSGEPAYFLPAFTPFGYTSEQFDFFGNALAVLLNVGSVDQHDSLLKIGQRIIEPLPLRIAPSFWPPIFPGSAEWEQIRSYYSIEFRNFPYSYHNGGSWPMVSSWWALALNRRGNTLAAEQLLEHMVKACALGGGRYESWGFFEEFNSQTGAPEGTPHQSWSISSLLLTSTILRGQNLLGW